MSKSLQERCVTEEGLLTRIQNMIATPEFQDLLAQARVHSRPRSVASLVGADAIGLSALENQRSFGANDVLDFMENFPASVARLMREANKDEAVSGTDAILKEHDPFHGQRE